MDEADAIEATQRLTAALVSALVEAEAETEALRHWDQAKVLECTVRREVFAAESAHLSEQLRVALGSGPKRSHRLQALLEELRRLAAQLAARDSVNKELAQRVLSFTKAYFNALLPRPQAYDRRGQATSSSATPSTISQRL